MIFDSVLSNSSAILTCAQTTGSPEQRLGSVRGVIGISAGRVAFLGSEAPRENVGDATEWIDAQDGFVTPGLVDCHTHVVFAGDRADEFEARCQGKSYLEIAQAGGGINKTVAATRQASEEELVKLALPRLRRLLEHGVTTVEIKTGYGLSFDDELKMLRVIAKLKDLQPLELIPTLLALHTVPPEFQTNRSEYLKMVNERLLPQVAQQNLAHCCDVFVEQSAFTHDEAKAHVRKARQLGFDLRMHVDQLTPNQGAQLACELKSRTADHLEQISPAGIEALKQSQTIAVLAPTSTLFTRARPFAPGRALCDAGVKVAICSNMNPGSSHSENIFLALGLACVENGLTPAEALLGVTAHGADAAGAADAGRIRIGSKANLVVFHAESYRSLPYCFGMNQVGLVMVNGQTFHKLARTRGT
jgi:imidazolonepropionase